MSRLIVLIVLALIPGLSSAAGALPPDPSTYQPYSCALPQDITYNDAQYGAITGRVYRPIGGFCANNSAPPADRPLVLILNGAGYTYFDYDIVARHLAYNGFVAIVVQADEPNPVMSCAAGPFCVEDRARKGLAYLKLFQANWTWASQVDFTDISLAGHSRGGEAAVEAAAIIRWEEPGLGNPGVRAVVSLAPTDIGDDGLIGRRRLLGRESPAFLVLYGSRDEQVSGYSAIDLPPPSLPRPSGFALYDRAGSEGSLEGFPISLDNQVEKAMQFVYRANHEQFSDRCGTPWCHHPVLSCANQQKVAKGMVNAFLRWKVLGESDYKVYFDGTLQDPWGLEIWPQFSNGNWGSRRVIDNFQDGEVGTNTMGGALAVHGNLTATVVDNWQTEPNSLHGPEDGQRLEVTHDLASPSNILQWVVPATKANVSGFSYLSFRIGQGMGSVGPARVKVRLFRGGLWSGLVSSDVYGEIPEPEHMGGYYCDAENYSEDRTIVHLRTIRIPLSAFGGDLTNLEKVQIRFEDATTQDKILYLDNLELAKQLP